jgi:hypothetical protein
MYIHWDGVCNWYIGPLRTEFPNYYHCRPEACNFYIEWLRTPGRQDGTVCGVLADYLEDHRQELLTGATGPSDPAARLDALIDYLRDRFRSQQ